VEAGMDSVIVVDLVKGRACPWPRLESDEFLMTTGSARPLEDAFRIAHGEMIAWLGEESGFSPLDVYQLLDPNYTFVAKVAKRWLPSGTPMGGVHDRLKEMGRSYLAARS
jgi:acetamidase/formamidase